MRTLVVGFGKPILGDDGAGWRVAFGFRACDPCFGCATPTTDSLYMGVTQKDVIP